MRHPLAGKKVSYEQIINIPNLVSLYYVNEPDVNDPTQKVSFGTSGHRGTSLNSSFTESHILAIVQAICDFRREQDIAGPLYLGKDTHALSDPAEKTALEVLAANGVEVMVEKDSGFTPTPVISHAILVHNKGRKENLADGIVITPSHNPPDNGGIKYNATHGGPADTEITSWIANRANELLANGLRDVPILPFGEAIQSPSIHRYDFISPYVDDLEQVIDMDAIKSADLRIGADALGGAGLAYWHAIAQRYGLNIDVLNNFYDPTFRFMHIDHDGAIRMDCSSPYAMAGLINLKEKYDIAFGNDPDFDRHGIVTKKSGLMNPNHYLAVAIWYLFQNRPEWSRKTAIGKTLVSSSLIDRVAAAMGRELKEVPVGFKWFVSGLADGSYGFGGEESAGASFLRRDGTVWSTDKDGFILCLLAAEILAKTRKDPGDIYEELADEHGRPFYKRLDAPATMEQKRKLASLSPDKITASTLAGEKIEKILTHAPANAEPIGGLKVQTQNGWFAARPSGTENIYKIYAESFVDEAHLDRIIAEAREIVTAVLK
ncbi:alpha-D-glucose phosphate-specific phosphoglucomutase [candidate division KSB1 bacterium]|nr:alpha-D-glucose phosphate-specific phosphoglucomutase [candidate division KSB1 bacterium]RQW01450.1 MAG: alpha-D-glucose phosphate-specific phosphoglucomutase [candidate division KSB1 bacterium]